MSYPSNVRSVFGDVDPSRNQLGVGWSGIATTGLLWDLAYAANHYCIDADSDITLELPSMGLADNQAQPGHWITITNTSDFIITINNSAVLPVTRIAPDSSAKITANVEAVLLWTVEYNTSPKASLRAGVDPISDPDPIIGGLIVPAGSGEISIPITIADQSIGIANPYIFDPLGLFTVNTASITVQPGRYQIQAGINIISFAPGAIAAEGKIIQIMRDVDMIYNAPPICTASIMSAMGVTSPLTAFVWTLNTSANFSISAPETLAIKFLPNNTTDIVIALTSNMTLIQLD
jgi:hypothetical protein